MIETKKYLTADNLKKLRKFIDVSHYKVATSYRLRMGKNKNKNPSVYLYHKWYNMDSHERDIIRKVIPVNDMDKMFICWFLKYPVGGFLDEMTTWNNSKITNNIRIYAIALDNNLDIIIEGEEYSVKKGHCIKFPINKTHSVPRSNRERNWFCMLIAETD